MPGAYANVTLIMAQTNDAIIAPTQSIVPKIKGQNLFIVRNGKAKSIDVELADRTDLNVRITSGNVNPGDTIITTNILRIKDETPVKITKIQ